jgi:hypothetical protein
VPAVCDGVDPLNIIPLSVKPAILKDTEDFAGSAYDKWVLKGQFVPFAGYPFDPVTQAITIVLNQDVTLYEGTIPPGVFLRGGSERTPRWSFRMSPIQPDIPGAEGWRFGRFRSVGSKVGPLNRLPFRIGGRGVGIPVNLAYTDANPDQPVFRATIKVGDDLCATAVVACLRRNSDHMLRCFAVPASA